MTKKAKSAKNATKEPSKGDSRTDPAVDSLLRELDHPLKREIETVRQTILGVSPKICEGFKWNSLSFRTTEFFATLNWRCRDQVQLVFHLGAKVKDNTTKGFQITDPKGLIKWLAKDRGLVTVGKGKEVQANRFVLRAIVREWIKQV